jgi:hypothetical protein
MIAVV